MANKLQETLDQLEAHYREHGGEGSQHLCDQASDLLEQRFNEERAKQASRIN